MLARIKRAPTRSADPSCVPDHTRPILQYGGGRYRSDGGKRPYRAALNNSKADAVPGRLSALTTFPRSTTASDYKKSALSDYHLLQAQTYLPAADRAGHGAPGAEGVCFGSDRACSSTTRREAE
jgi:hypothetical protein